MTDGTAGWAASETARWADDVAALLAARDGGALSARAAEAFRGGAVRLEILCDPTDRPALLLAVASGFRSESLRRGAAPAGGGDLAVFARLAGDDGAAIPPVWPDPPTPKLTDGVLTLRPLTASDWATVLEEHNNPESLRWALTDAMLSEAGARAAAGRAAYEWVVGPAARFVMDDAASGHPAGLIGVLRMGPPDVGLIGYGVLPAWRGRGLTSRALALLAGWVFATTSIGRLELGHKVDNVASGKAALRAGWVMEGTHTGRLKNADGTFSDEVHYGRTRPLP